MMMMILPMDFVILDTVMIFILIPGFTFYNDDALFMRIIPIIGNVSPVYSEDSHNRPYTPCTELKKK